LLDGSGQRKQLAGTIENIKQSFGFINCDSPSLSVYFELRDVGAPPDKLYVGLPVFFELGFSLRGPAAKYIEPTLR